MVCRQLACFCKTSTAALTCLRAQIPIPRTLDKCQNLQSETDAALQLDSSSDEALGRVLDITPLLEACSSSTGNVGSSSVLRAAQLVAVAQTALGLMDLREIVLSRQSTNLTDSASYQ